MGMDSEIEPGNTETESSVEAKQGHLFCGLCCDMRYATIIVNFCNILTSIITMSLVIQAHREAQEVRARGGVFQGYIYPENRQKGFDDMEAAMKWVAGLAVVGWVLSFVAIYGAYTFRAVPVSLNLGYIPIHYLTANAMLTKASNSYDDYQHEAANWIVKGVLVLIYLYPQFMYLTEVRSGILSKETYVRERKCCCCC